MLADELGESTASKETEELWKTVLTSGDSKLHSDRRRWRKYPGAPRCKVCEVPLGGKMFPLIRVVTRRSPSGMSPNYCDLCESMVQSNPGGAEIELSLLFADIRGSTTLAEHMSPAEWTKLVNRFYDAANRVLIESDALIDKLVGDEVVGLYLPFLDNHAASAVGAAKKLLEATGHDDPGGPWMPVGVGVHTGVAYVGAVGSVGTVTDFTAMGDAVNVAARLGGAAKQGEILIGEEAYAAAAEPFGKLQSRSLEVKGRRAAVVVRALQVGP